MAESNGDQEYGGPSLEQIQSRFETYQLINADLSKKVQELKISSSQYIHELVLLRNENIVEHSKNSKYRKTFLDVRNQGIKFIREFEATMAQAIATIGIEIDEDTEFIDPLQFRPPSRIQGYTPGEQQYEAAGYLLNTVIEEEEHEISSQNTFAPCDDVVASTPLHPNPTGVGTRKVLGDIKNTKLVQPVTLKPSKTTRKSRTPTIADIPELLPLETPQRANIPIGTRKLSNEISDARENESSQQISALNANSKASSEGDFTATPHYVKSSIASSIDKSNVNVSELTVSKIRKSSKIIVTRGNVSSIDMPNDTVSDCAKSVASASMASQTRRKKSSIEFINNRISQHDKTDLHPSSMILEKSEIENSTDKTDVTVSECAKSATSKSSKHLSAKSGSMTSSSKVGHSQNPSIETKIRKVKDKPSTTTGKNNKLPTSESEDEHEEDVYDDDNDPDWVEIDQVETDERYNRPCHVPLQNTSVTNSQLEGFEQMREVNNSNRLSSRASSLTSEKPSPKKSALAMKRAERKRILSVETGEKAQSVPPKKKRMSETVATTSAETEPATNTKKKRAKKRKSIETLIRTSTGRSKRRSGSLKSKPSTASDTLNTSNGSTISEEGRPTRRCRPTVSYREPSLRKKLRR